MARLLTDVHRSLQRAHRRFQPPVSGRRRGAARAACARRPARRRHQQTDRTVAAAARGAAPRRLFRRARLRRYVAAAQTGPGARTDTPADFSMSRPPTRCSSATRSPMSKRRARPVVRSSACATATTTARPPSSSARMLSLIPSFSSFSLPAFSRTRLIRRHDPRRVRQTRRRRPQPHSGRRRSARRSRHAALDLPEARGWTVFVSARIGARRREVGTLFDHRPAGAHGAESGGERITVTTDGKVVEQARQRRSARFHRSLHGALPRRARSKDCRASTADSSVTSATTPFATSRSASRTAPHRICWERPTSC